jgi:signal transduction histidine kinase/DNA-binding response OmpR family regulator/PAS domain-containing protein
MIEISRGADEKINTGVQRTCQISESRYAISNALNKTIEILTAHKEASFDDVMSNGLRPFAEAAGLNRIAVFRLLEGNDRLGQRYVWKYGKSAPLDAELIEVPKNPPMIRMLKILMKGEYIHGRLDVMAEDEAAFLGLFGIRTILFVPIFTYNKFWGMVVLEDHTNYRYFDEDCLDLLCAAARLCANAFIRMEMTHNIDDAFRKLERREQMVDTLNKMAIVFLSQSEGNFEDTMMAGVGKIADVIQLDRFSIWRNIPMPDAMHVSQIYHWDRESGGTTVPTKGLEDVTYARLAPRWEKLLASGETINSPVKLLPEADMLQSFGCVTAFVTPLFINNVFWGFALFEDRCNERYFEEDYTEIMLSAAFLCANTFIRAEMERKIIDANEFNHAILNAAPIGFTVFDEGLRAFDCNNSIVNILGTTKKYYIDHFLEFSPEYQTNGGKSRKKAFELVKRTLDGKKQAFEWTHRSSSGELIPFEVTLTRAKYNGKYIVMGYQYDLRSIRKMMENINEQSELLKIRLKQQELISEISRGFISSGDSKTYIKEAIAKLGRYHNVSMVLIFGIDYQRNDTYLAYNWVADNVQLHLIDFDFFGFVSSRFPETLPESAAVPVISCADTAANTDGVCSALSSVGVTSFICAPLYVEGRLWGVLSVEQRFMPRQWTENEEKFVAMTASTIAGVIMRNIYNTMLKDALHKATVASKAKGEFLSNMSHEMRTPLNAIIGMTAIGRNASTIERKDYALGKIDDASTHLLGVINDVLDMSKIEANMLELSPIEFNFERMLQKVVAVINFRMDEKRQKLTVHIDREIPQTVIADDQRLAQVITNLLGNAVKFTPEEGLISLDARFMGEENGLCSIQISISDTGIGISPEQQKRLFNSFQQAESSITRKYGGTGLGLAISKSIVEMMGGTIRVQSEPGKGSTFVFMVQVQRGAEEKQGLSVSDVNLNDVRIMAIDDDLDILEYFREIAQGLGVRCDTAASGAEALKLIDRNGAYHIYFTDWKMPGMDGIQLAHELKVRASANADSVVIMISAAEWNAVEAEAKKAGVDRFLPKPLFPSTIAAAINESLGVNRQQAQTKQTDIEGIFAGRHILLVEDVDINREIVKTLLEPTRIEIDSAENGVEAVRMFTETPNKYNMIFMDVQMPEMDGYEATQRIRAIEAGLPPEHPQRVPIIAMTANVFREDVEKCLEAGMDSHVGKPLDFDEVLGRLRTYLR